MRVRVDEDKCCGAGQCVLTAPKVFGQQDSGIVSLLDETPPKELHAAVRVAARVCPCSVISLQE